jgi:hypothetical protein
MPSKAEVNSEHERHGHEVLLVDGTAGEVGSVALPPIENAPGSYVRARA